MTNEEAKKILSLYRPGTMDRTDPSFTEALERAKTHPPQDRSQDESDPELSRWFLEHRSSYLSIRAKFRGIPVPPALKDRILAERQTSTARVIPFRPMVLLQAAAALVLCLGLVALFWRSHSREDEFDTYRTRMTRTALQPYGMDLESHDLQSIKKYLAGRNAPADYRLPDGVSKAQPVGCAVLHWQGEPVSMLCFHSGQPLPPGEKSDLWLFIINQTSVRNGPAARPPIVAQVKRLMTGTWSQDGKMYVLAAAGDEAFLRKYF
jgi:hypothetical protein